MLQWAQDSVDIAKSLHAQSNVMYREFGSFRSNLLSLVRADGAMDLYDGVLRVRKDTSTTTCAVFGRTVCR